VLAHPADHGSRIGQVPEDLVGRGGRSTSVANSSLTMIRLACRVIVIL
jgi:hypothetical protein